jgi:isocitrate/isopropylmalate dehydrogenase
MSRYRIALMPGDGIGPEVMEAARLILDHLSLDAEYLPTDVGWRFWCDEGDPLPQRTVDLLRTCTCALFGAITSMPRAEAQRALRSELQGRGLTYRSPIVRLRQIFDLYVNLRPCRSYAGNPLNYRPDIDLVVFRENTEGLYAGVEFHPLPADVRRAMAHHSRALKRFDDIPDEDIAVSLRLITRKGAHRVVRRAFEYAERFGYADVTLVDKANVLRETGGLMIEEAGRVAADFQRIKLNITYIDAQVMWLIKNPEQFGVMVASNLFGDVLSDLTAQLVGGLGFACSGNLGDHFALFEPTHGSAPKYAGKGIANPIAMILSVKMMLDWLNETEKARALEDAVASVVAAGTVRTRDMGGSASTYDMAEAVVQQLK